MGWGPGPRAEGGWFQLSLPGSPGFQRDRWPCGEGRREEGQTLVEGIWELR